MGDEGGRGGGQEEEEEGGEGWVGHLLSFVLSDNVHPHEEERDVSL